ncbi:MAG TPA: S8 family serine peptidase [Vicinamibacteria bacterium]|nr:S8 family serine peptidase [Vicinamibacteria bacterium]
MRLDRLACAVVAGLTLAAAVSSRAADAAPYLLRLKRPWALERVCHAYDLKVVRRIGWLSLYVVTGPSETPDATLLARVRADQAVYSFEPDLLATTGETAARSGIEQTTQPLEEALAVDRTLVDFHGALAWNGYVNQPALAKLEIGATRTDTSEGEGITVAVIDSGVDPDHPLLRDVLRPGYDFTRNVPGASEWGDIVQSTAAILDGGRCRTSAPGVTGEDGTIVQSTAAILDSSCVPGRLTQSTAAILDTESQTRLAGAPPLPPAFGHGTIVAGLIHVVAPRARILPLKAFAADGTGRSADIAQAIYYAVAQGARVLNLSFTFENESQEVLYATAYAAQQGCIVVAAAGNDGLVVQRWPAEHDWVVGVGATTLWDTRAPFSNQGFGTFKVGAPGVDLVSTFPGGYYAAVSGTSFSTPLVSGAVALMGSAAPRLDWSAAANVVRIGKYAEIADVVRGEDHKYPQRIIVPSAVDLAEILARNSIKQVKPTSETP